MDDPIIAGLKAEIDELRAGMIQIAQECENAINDIAQNTNQAFMTVDEALGLHRYILAKNVPSDRLATATAEFRAIREKEIADAQIPSTGNNVN